MTRTSIYNSLSPPPPHLSFFSTLLFHFLPPGSTWPHWPASLLRRADSKVAEKQQKLTSADRQWFIANYRCLTILRIFIQSWFLRNLWNEGELWICYTYSLKLCVCLLSLLSNLSRIFSLITFTTTRWILKLCFYANSATSDVYIRRFSL